MDLEGVYFIIIKIIPFELARFIWLFDQADLDSMSLHSPDS